MESSLTLFAVPPPLSVSLAIDVAGVVMFAVSVALLAATMAERGSRALSRVRAACVVSTGLLVATSFLHWPSRWALALSCLGFLVSLQAVAVAFGRLPSLRSYLDRRGAGAERGWWDEFERDFQRHTRRGWREQNPLRRAVTRRQTPTSETEQAPAEWRDEWPERWA
jgi:hypothetical protein